MPTSAAKGGIVTRPQPHRNAVKSFTVHSRSQAPEADREPLPFGMEWKDGDGELHYSPLCRRSECQGADDHSWHARPWLIPDILVMQLPNMAIDMNSVPLFKIFEHTLGDDYPAFYSFINSPTVYVDAAAFLPILEWFIEEGAGRPTRPS
jgi:hypothetical protein